MSQLRANFVPIAGFVVVAAIILTFVLLASGNDSDGGATANSEAAESLPSVDSPEGVALRALRYVQVGSPGSAVALYHPRVREVVGARRVANSLAPLRVGLSGARLRVSLRETTPRGELVAVSVSGPQSTGEYAFVLRRSGSSWVIVNDSLLGDALAEYEQGRSQQRIDPDAEEPSSRAIRDGAEASEEYRSLFGFD